jgi:hypothetical protein
VSTPSTGTPGIGGVRVVTAHDVCTAIEALLTDHLPGWAAAAGLAAVRRWDQLPTPEALSAAATPAGAITSPGLTAPPTRRRGAYEATWRIAVAVYDRGSDHTDTQRRARTWAALVRTVLIGHPHLGGLARDLQWVGEDYAPIPGVGAARTLGGCVVAVDVTVADVVPASAPPALGGPDPAPTVRATRSTVTVRPTLQE